MPASAVPASASTDSAAPSEVTPLSAAPAAAPCSRAAFAACHALTRSLRLRISSSNTACSASLCALRSSSDMRYVLVELSARWLIEPEPELAEALDGLLLDVLAWLLGEGCFRPGELDRERLRWRFLSCSRSYAALEKRN